MAHADDATKAWVLAHPTVNGDNNVTSWDLRYKYTLAVEGSDDYVHEFRERVVVTPTKAKTAYTKAELLGLVAWSGKPTVSEHWDKIFNKKYAYHISSANAKTRDASFDVSSLNDS
jgi:hypothetical protein|tara:strand:+ start:240 stop:587 length:348 start_codon:yes stop_codon:yes gene_type:complete